MQIRLIFPFYYCEFIVFKVLSYIFLRVINKKDLENGMFILSCLSLTFVTREKKICVTYIFGQQLTNLVLISYI